MNLVLTSCVMLINTVLFFVLIAYPGPVDLPGASVTGFGAVWRLVTDMAVECTRDSLLSGGFSTEK